MCFILNTCLATFPPFQDPLSVRYGMDKPEHDKEGCMVTDWFSHSWNDRSIHVPLFPPFQVPPLSVRYSIDDRPEQDKEGRVVTVESIVYMSQARARQGVAGVTVDSSTNPSPHPSLQVLPLSVRYGMDKPEHDKEGRVVIV
ncbi:unnamed protein product [Closterium sp. Naga37s-1]|nr:unnamed protein product [Closterium sp. Naga37s-1]